MDTAVQPAPVENRANQLLGLVLGPGVIYLLLISGLAGTLGSGVLYALAWLVGSAAAFQYSTVGYWAAVTVFYAAGFGGWLIYIYRRVCGQPPARLNRRPGTLGADLGAGLLLFAAAWILCRLFYWLQTSYFPLSSTTFIEDTTQAMLMNPWAIVMLIGPYSFLAAGFMEELCRCFLLERAWALWPGRAGVSIAIGVAVVLFGFCHLYQGMSGVVNTAFFGLLMALYYWKFGRVIPLMLAHGLYSAAVSLEGFYWLYAYGQA
ncbi:CPBP family intramembrane metalloprotease [bacterium]|nr:CPBP family intramembrane metalloprotease [bacterium]